MKHNFNTSIDKFMEDLELEVAPATIQAYWYNLNVVKKYLAANNIEYLEELSKDKIVTMIKHFKKTCKNVTINKRIRLLKKTFEYHNVKNNYLMNFKKLRRTTVHYDPFTEAQLKKIMNYANGIETYYPYEFTRLIIIYLLLDTGIRGSELLHVEIKNIDLDEKVIKLTHTKTKKQGYVFFSSITKELLQEYLKIGPTRKYLLWNYKSYNQYTYIHLRNFMDHLKKECNLPRCHAHMFRHTFATDMHERGIDFLVLQDLMRHESPDMTKIYTHTSYKLKKKIHESYSIINNISSDS